MVKSCVFHRIHDTGYIYMLIWDPEMHRSIASWWHIHSMAYIFPVWNPLNPLSLGSISQVLYIFVQTFFSSFFFVFCNMCNNGVCVFKYVCDCVWCVHMYVLLCFCPFMCTEAEKKVEPPALLFSTKIP